MVGVGNCHDAYAHVTRSGQTDVQRLFECRVGKAQIGINQQRGRAALMNGNLCRRVDLAAAGLGHVIGNAREPVPNLAFRLCSDKRACNAPRCIGGQSSGAKDALQQVFGLCKLQSGGFRHPPPAITSARGRKEQAPPGRFRQALRYSLVIENSR